MNKQGNCLLEKFSRKDNPEDRVKNALKAVMNRKELLYSLEKINRLYELDKMDKPAKFSFLRNQLRDCECFAKFVLCRQPST